MGNASVVTGTPTAALRQALFNLLQEGSFRFDIKTRGLIRDAEQALRATRPAAAHERAVGLFCYSKEYSAFMPVTDEIGLDAEGKPRPGCEYLFRQSNSLACAMPPRTQPN